MYSHYFKLTSICNVLYHIKILSVETTTNEKFLFFGM